MEKTVKVGNLVSWYSDSVNGCNPVQDTGLITKVGRPTSVQTQFFIVWQSGEGNGWFDQGHPNIGFINAVR